MSINGIVAESYDLYRSWFERSLDLIWKLPDELRSRGDPMAEISKAEQKSQQSATKSLCTAIKDTVAMTDRYTREEVHKLDEIFDAEGLPKLHSMRMLFSKEIIKLLRIDSVDNDQDYHALKNLEDLDIPEESKVQVIKLCGEYELRKY